MIKTTRYLRALVLVGALLGSLWLLDQILPAEPDPLLLGTWRIDDRHHYPIPDLGTCSTFQPERSFISYSADVVSPGTYRMGILSRQRLRLTFTWGLPVDYTITMVDRDHLIAQDNRTQYRYSRFTGDPLTLDCLAGQG
jgi:hypothetical protein